MHESRGLGDVYKRQALLAPCLGDNVINIITTVAGTMLGGLMAVFLLGMFAPRANAPGVLIGLMAGAACLLVVIVATDVPKWWYGAFTIFPTMLVGAIASRFFAPPPTEALSATLWHQAE